MGPGRKNTPTELKLVKGNPGRRRLPENEPKPEVTNPDPPEHLSEIAKAEWRRVCPQLAELGLMTDIDVGVLSAYCAAYGDWIEAEERQRGRPTVLKTHNGNIVQSPYVSMIRKARMDMVRFAAEFGMSPSARAGMSVEIGSIGRRKTTTDAASRYFGTD